MKETSSMVMLVIQTQTYENYGAHDWNGEGECPQYWKPKGGSEYKVLNVDPNSDLTALVKSLRPHVEKDDHYWRENMIDWSVESDDYLTWFEQSQLWYDGKISYPARVLAVA
jgi:hypothetical protein